VLSPPTLWAGRIVSTPTGPRVRSPGIEAPEIVDPHGLAFLVRRSHHGDTE